MSAPHPSDPPARHAGLGTGTRVWLARHAEVAASWRERAYGDLDVPLSPAGQEASERLGAAFAGRELCCVLSSPLTRARTLGEAAARASGAALRIEAGLRELFRGAWQGKPRRDWEGSADGADYYADPWSFDRAGVENDASLLSRALPVLEGAVRDAQGGELLLTAHQNIVRVLLAHTLGIAPAASFAVRIDPAHLILLLDSSSGWVLLHANVADPNAAAYEGMAVFDGMGPTAARERGPGAPR